MNDRELLEMAAKAAGLTLQWRDGYGQLVTDGGYPWVGCRSWRPLDDDGDALRLAVKLGLNIMQQPDCAEPWVDVCGPDCEADELHGTDPYAATRRAIVRAAAAIGEAA